MILTDEKSEIIASYLIDDPERAQKLYQMTAEEAASEINAAGGDVTAGEIAEFGRQLSVVSNGGGSKDGELDISAIENVAGGGLSLSKGIIKIIGKFPIGLPQIQPMPPIMPKFPIKWI